jgi:thiol-disulfide isomerase/thioredoxin
MRMTGLVARKGAQPGVALGHTPAETRGERRDDRRLEIADAGDPCESGEHHRRDREERGGAEAGSATAQRARDELRAADRAENSAGRSADRFIPFADQLADDDAERGGGHECDGEQCTRRAEDPRDEDADPDPETRADADPVPVAHDRSVGTRGVSSLRPAGNVELPAPPADTQTQEDFVTDDARPLLVFFWSEQSGPARRMESLLAHLARKERSRLRVMRVDVDGQPELAERFKVASVPALVLVSGKRVVDRIDGRASAPKIEAMVERHVSGAVPA